MKFVDFENTLVDSSPSCSTVAKFKFGWRSLKDNLVSWSAKMCQTPETIARMHSIVL